MAQSTSVDDLEKLVAQRQEKINVACESLFQVGYRRHLFTIKNIHDHGYTDNDFINYIKPLTSITDLKELSALCFNARKQQSWPSLYTFHQFLDFIKWLNTEDGKKAKAEISITISKMNLEEKPIPQADISLAQMLVDYAASRRLARTRIHEEIAELKRRQKELEMESVNIDTDLKTKLGPIYEYKALSITELRIEAYKLYLEDCWSKKTTPIPRHHEMGFEKAMEAFGGTVKECHLVKYLNDPVRKENIKEFFKQKILRMEYTGDNKSQGGDSFRNFAVADSREASNEIENIVHVFDGVFDETQHQNLKRARCGNEIPKKL